MSWTSLLARWFNMVSPRSALTIQQGADHIVSLNPNFHRAQSGTKAQARVVSTWSPKSTKHLSTIRGSTLGLAASPKCLQIMAEESKAIHQEDDSALPGYYDGFEDGPSSSFRTASISSLSPEELTGLLDRLESESLMRQAGTNFQAYTPPSYRGHGMREEAWFTARPELTPVLIMSGGTLDVGRGQWPAWRMS